MYVDWSSEKAKRIYTGAGIVVALALAFCIRMIPTAGIWIFDVIVLAIATWAVWEMMRARKSDAKGVMSYYVISYRVGA